MWLIDRPIRLRKKICLKSKQILCFNSFQNCIENHNTLSTHKMRRKYQYNCPITLDRKDLLSSFFFFWKHIHFASAPHAIVTTEKSCFFAGFHFLEKKNQFFLKFLQFCCHYAFWDLEEKIYFCLKFRKFNYLSKMDWLFENKQSYQEICVFI